LVVEPSQKNVLYLGGTQLAYSIGVADESSRTNPRLVRSGLAIIPNPVGVFSSNDTVVYVYGELYNLAYDAEVTSSYRLTISVLDETGVIAHHGSGAREKPGPTAVIARSVDINGWEPGKYNLRLHASDKKTGAADSTNIDFSIISPTQARALREKLETPDPYDSLTLEQRLRLVTYMLTPEEKAALKSLTDSGKDRFLSQFWAEHDDSPQTTENENRLKLIERYKFAVDNFSQNARDQDGWNTDPGRIYMTYGPWDVIKDVPTPRTGFPYQIWHYYHFREGKFFVFLNDKRGHEYRLVHSNVEQEAYSQTWHDMLLKGRIDLEGH
jgi:GWxTD domain-containing protein